MKIQYRHLWVGEKFKLDGITYNKTNHNRSYIDVKGNKQFINMKKNKLVESLSDRF